MEKHLFRISPHYVLTPSKHLVDGDVLIDDRPENVVSFYRTRFNRIGILLDQPWNSNTELTILDRAKTWEDILKKLL